MWPRTAQHNKDTTEPVIGGNVLTAEKKIGSSRYTAGEEKTNWRRFGTETSFGHIEDKKKQNNICVK